MRGLEGKRIIVAGSASGIRAATARRLHAEGAKVLLGDINPEGLADGESVGGLDGIANIAADVSPATFVGDKNVLETDDSLWQHVLNVNLVGFARLAQQSIPLLQEAGGGAIVTLTSAAAILGSPGQVAYGSSKAGIEALTSGALR